jgi:hypothetical protein
MKIKITRIGRREHGQLFIEFDSTDEGIEFQNALSIYKENEIIIKN